MSTKEYADEAVSLLRGYTAIDLTDLRGQFCGRVLGDLGMEVIKVEPSGGDPVRQLGPFTMDAKGKKISLRFAHLNTNKKSIMLDYLKKENQRAFLRLAEQVDVIIESFSPGFLESIGLGFSELAKINPGLIRLSLTGFGQTGPRRHFSYTDMVVYALSGLMFISGDPNLPPCKPPETQAYYFGNLMGVLGLLAALYKRERTGVGDWIDVSMQESLATQEHMIRLYANAGEILRRAGSQHAQVAPATIFPCRDGYVYVYVSRAHWPTLLKVWPDHPAEFAAPEWLENGFRRARADRINQLFAQFTMQFGKDELTTLLQSRGIPCTPVNRPRDFIQDSQITSRRFFVPVGYSADAVIEQPSSPYLLDGQRPLLRPAPALAQHQEEVLSRAEHRAKKGGSAAADSPQLQHLPLKGVRILSFDKVLAGPYGMTLLAELGAEVIKVESRDGGLDPFRFFGASQDVNLSPRFLEFNRNKLSITVNLKHPQGPALIKDLVRHCDVVMDNFSVRVMPSLRLSYEELVKIKQDIICLRMPGMGCVGPKSGYVTLGPNITAFTGITYLWNHPETDPPVGSQTVFPDYVSGTLAASLIMAAILYRVRTGRGVSIDLSQAEAAAFMIGVSLMQALAADKEIKPIGNLSPDLAPHGCYPCKGDDRWCVIVAESDEQWGALARAIGKPELAADERYQTSEARRQHNEEIDRILSAWTRDKDCYEVMARSQQAGVPCGVVQNGADLTADEHLKARGFLVQHRSERIGEIVLPGFPIKFQTCRIEPRWEFPELGRDNERVLASLLGYSKERIAQLIREGVVA